MKAETKIKRNQKIQQEMDYSKCVAGILTYIHTLCGKLIEK